ncbi:MFS transporter [Pseudonocardiaceae bacterium YIM PH 21723]|nr:MFS transporter [Pseudonocardiaceae bacterium YIM PH 21723]
MTTDSDRQVPSGGRVRRLFGRLALDTEPLQHVAFRRLYLSSVVTVIGSQLTVVAVPKQIYDMTQSSAYVGLAGLFALVPLLVFGLWGGAVADVMDRRKLLLITNIGTSVCLLLFWIVALTGVGSVWLVLILLAVQQAFFAVNQPTRSAAVSRLVPAALLPSAGALTSMVMSFGSVMGPMLAGVLLPVTGLPLLYLLDAIAVTATLWAVWKLPPLPPLNEVTKRRAGLREVLDGFRYLFTQRILLASFVLDIIAMVFGMPRALFPQMADQTFGGGGLPLGLLYAAIPIGAFLCGLFSGWVRNIARHGVAVVVSVIAWGLAIIGFGLAGSLWWALAFLALAGAADMISMVFRGAILQTAATDEMRGRMQGVFIVVVAGGPRLADALHGAAGDDRVLGTSLAASGGGALVVVLAVLAILALPAFWRYRGPVRSR